MCWRFALKQQFSIKVTELQSIYAGQKRKRRHYDNDQKLLLTSVFN